jgi:hypothetical protein
MNPSEKALELLPRIKKQLAHEITRYKILWDEDMLYNPSEELEKIYIEIENILKEQEKLRE